MTSPDNKELRPQQAQYTHPVVCRFNINDDYYEDGLVLYADGLLEINVGGYCVGRKIKGWFRTADEIEQLVRENASLKLRYQELEEQTGKTGAERLRLMEENEKLRKEFEFVARQGKSVVTHMIENSVLSDSLSSMSKLCDELAEALEEKGHSDKCHPMFTTPPFIRLKCECGLESLLKKYSATLRSDTALRGEKK
jgi:hypothetical protein